MFRTLALIAAVEVAACGNAASTAAPAFAPRGATIEPSGYATIIEVPPAPFTPQAPSPPKPMTPEQMAGHEQFARAAKFQNEVMGEAIALDRRLRRAEKGNYVNRYFDNEGDPRAVFQFLRDGPATLRKYSKNPRFFGETVRFSEAELLAKLDWMIKTFAADRVIDGGGTGRNSVDVTITVPEDEFRALVARKGVTIPEGVNLEFRATRSASELNKPLPANIAPLVRVFPRDDRPVGMVNAINSTAKVVLRDGCFRATDQADALVLFPLGANLFVDSEGYLAFGSAETPGYARVGEKLIFMGSIGEVRAPELVAPIHAACGSGKVIKVNETRSAAADRAQDHVATNFQAFRDLKEMYGLSDARASQAFEKCKKQSGTGMCLLSPPRPMRSEECPAGSKLSHGLCRTPEGYIRPLPDWLKEFAAS